MPIAPRNTSGGTGNLSADLTASTGGASQRHRFRSDLKILPAGAEGSPDVRVIDPASGSEHLFTATEFFLCQAADGESTLSAIQERYFDRFGQTIESRALNIFYRRLRADGLLVRSDAARSPATPASTEPDELQDPAASERARLPFQGERRTSQRVTPRRVAGKNGSEELEFDASAEVMDEAGTEPSADIPSSPEPARPSKRVMPRRIAGKNGGEAAEEAQIEASAEALDAAGTEPSADAPVSPEPARPSKRTMPRRIAGKKDGENAGDLAETLDEATVVAAEPMIVPEPTPRASQRVMPRRITSKKDGEPSLSADVTTSAEIAAGSDDVTPAALVFETPDEPSIAAPTATVDLADELQSSPAEQPPAINNASPAIIALPGDVAAEAPSPQIEAPAARPIEPVAEASEPSVPEIPQAMAAPDAPPVADHDTPAPDVPEPDTAATAPATPDEPPAMAAPEPVAETPEAPARPRVTPTLAKRAAKPRAVGPRVPGKVPARPPAPLQRANIRVRPTGEEPPKIPAADATPATSGRLPPPEAEAGVRRPDIAAPAFDPNAFLGEMEDDDMFGGRGEAPAGRMARRRRPGTEITGPAGGATGGPAGAGIGAGTGLGGAGGFGGLGGGGGFGGGMGGFGGGGLGGGGMGGGGMGGGGRGEALLAALAARGRPGAGNAPPPPPHDRVSLFNPMGLYWALDILFWPMRYLHWLLWPLVVFTFFVIYQRWDDLTLDIFKTSWTWSTIALMLVSFLIVNLVARTTQGATIRAFGGQVRQFGLIVEFGFLPRFFIDRSDIPTMDRRGQLYCYSAPLVARLWLWSGGVLIWASQHGSGNNLHDYALVISHAALIEFMVVAFPLLPSDGMNWLLTWFGDPGLKKKAIVAFKAWVKGQPRPFFIKQEEEAGLVLFAIGAILCSFLFVFGLLTYFGIMLGSGLGGTGAVIFLGLCLGCALWMYGVFSNGGKNRGAMTLRELGLGPQDDTADEEARANDPAKVKERVSIAAWGRVIWAFIIVFLIAVAFLPYDYEASGEFEILPNARNQANAQTDGEIEKILVREGDWVKPGELLGQLSSWDQEHQVAVTKARLAEAKAKLIQVQEGAKTEQITVAEKEVESQKATVAFTEAEMKRQQELEKTGTASPAAYERAKSKYDNDVAKLNVAVANLALVKSSATQAELDARQADVERLTAELAYNQSQFERTRIRATAEGRVITPNLHLLVGKWLRSGNPLLETENTKTVDAEIAVPEADIALVTPGDTVRVKAWGYSDKEIPGKVVSIAPAADKRNYGMVVRAKATIPNEDGALRSQMTGYAKIDGDRMMVWQAFLRFIVRFFQVEVWSWIP